MQIGATNVKCVEHGGESSCSDTCTLSMRAQVMMNSDAAPTSQFCFLECKPIQPEDGTKCIALDAEEAEKARTEDGTGEDIHVVPEALQPPTVPPEPALLPVPGETPPDFKMKEPVSNKKVSPADEVLAEAAAAAASNGKAAGVLGALGQQITAKANNAEKSAEKAKKVSTGVGGIAPASAASFLVRGGAHR